MPKGKIKGEHARLITLYNAHIVIIINDLYDRSA